MSHASPQRWPITPEAILRTLAVSRLLELATHFRTPCAANAKWATVNATLLANPHAQAIPLLHQLKRNEIDEICRLAQIQSTGTTQRILAQLLPLCQPSPRGGREDEASGGAAGDGERGEGEGGDSPPPPTRPTM